MGIFLFLFLALVLLSILAWVEFVCFIWLALNLGSVPILEEYEMDVKKVIDFAITILTVFAEKTTTTLDNTALDMLKAIKDSPFFLDWLQSLFTKQSSIPDEALNHIDPNDPELIEAFQNSQPLLDWARRNRPDPAPGTPDDAKPLFAEIAALLKYLPILIEIWKAWKKANEPTA